MRLSHAEMLVKVRGAREAIQAWPKGGARPAPAVEMLRSLWPGATLYACWLKEEGDAVDETGRRRPEWVGLMRESSKSASSEHVPAPGLNLGGSVLASEEIRFGEELYGQLFLAVNEESLPAARMFLECCAQSIAMRLKIETLAAESAGDERLADVAETSIPIVHEFNNFLNGLLLHTAVLKIQLPQETHEGLAEMRRQALAAAALTQHYQDYRRRYEAPRLSVNLNQAVQSALESLNGNVPYHSPAPPANGATPSVRILTLPYGKVNDSASASVRVRLDLSPDSPQVMGAFNDLKRLCLFLLRSAAAVAGTQGSQIAVQTTRAAGKVFLRIEDAGPAVSSEQIAHLFEPCVVGRDGTNSLELAACKTITRRSAGVIRAEVRGEGGVVFTVEWDAVEG